MDPDKLTERAVALGLITQNQTQTMDEKAKYRLIFLPGFSTSRKVNDLSGRGVGMDVVKSNIESIGGKVTIESQPGLGSRFLIEVPLTLAIIPSQIVQTEHQRFAIPQANLVELVRIPPGRILKNRIYQRCPGHPATGRPPASGPVGGYSGPATLL